MKKYIYLLFVLLFSTAFAHAQALSGTATTTDASCPGNGSITISASGGTSPYQYSIISGPVTKDYQAEKIFTTLQAGIYNVAVKDASGTVYNINNVTVNSTYVTMNPTATATTEVCAGSNTGSITFSMPGGQGNPPYTYSVVSGPTQPATVTTPANSYTYQNLAPGTYQVRVTDACGAYQTRQVTLNAGDVYNLDVKVWARPSACDNMDYYVQPQRGTNFPHTIYAYGPTGNLVATITVNAGNLVTVPGVGVQAFKFTLPNPPTFSGTYYTFKYTDACVTDVNNRRVHATTPTLGGYDFSVITGSQCNLDLNARVMEGWRLPVTVTLTDATGKTYIQAINDEATRATVFNNITAGKYTVEIKDACDRKINSTYTVVTPNIDATLYYECGASLPDMTNLTVGGLKSGWGGTVTGTLTSGPQTYYSAVTAQTYTATYPITSSNSATNEYVRFSNLAPGTYKLTLTDGCHSINKDVTITAKSAFSFPQEVVTGCSGSRVLKSTSSAQCSSLNADIKKGTAEAVYANGINASNGFSVSNVKQDVYTIYYYTQPNSNINGTQNDVFTSTVMYQGKYLLKKSVVTVTDQPAEPAIDKIATSNCGNGTIAAQVFPSQSSTNIVGYQLMKPDGNYTDVQSSNIFNLPAYGNYTFRLIDTCGNAGVSSVNVQPNTPPVIQNKGNACLGGDITLFVDIPSYATALWTKPNGTTVSGQQLLIQNASYKDTGSYSVAVTYKVGSCSEVQTTSLKLGNCLSLPVNWGTFSAVIKNCLLVVNWSTLKETNNSYFEVQVSKDGTNWKTIGKVNSTATDGNSDAEIKYSFESKTTDILALMGISAFGLLALGFKRRNKLVQLIAGAAILFTFAAVGCSKNKDAALFSGNENNSRLLVRIVQVDKDGTQKTTGVIQAINE